MDLQQDHSYRVAFQDKEQFKNFSKMILKNGKDINEELQTNRSELENNLYIIDNNLKEL